MQFFIISAFLSVPSGGLSMWINNEKKTKENYRIFRHLGTCDTAGKPLCWVSLALALFYRYLSGQMFFEYITFLL